MQEIVMYALAASTLGEVRDYANMRSMTPPVFTLGFSVNLKLRLFNEVDNDMAYPISLFSNVASWTCVFDRDYNQSTTPVLVADNENIIIHEVTETVGDDEEDEGYTEEHVFTEIVIPIPDMNTEELVALIGTSESISNLNMELVGFDGEAKEIFGLQIKGFTVRNRIYYTGNPTVVEPDYLTASQVRALIASGAILQYSVDGTSWHGTQVPTDKYVRFRSASNAQSVWSEAIRLPDGTAGSDGVSPTVSVGSVTTVEAGSSAAVVNIGTSNAVVLDFYIPKGVNGSNGSNGISPIISVGSTTTGNPGTSAEVTSRVSSNITYLDFLIPRGSDGQGTENVTWGGISGTLSNQSDLVSALSSKQDAITDNNKLPYSRVSGAPTVNNGSLSIFSSGATVTFTANQSGNTSVTIPSVGSGTLTITSGGSVWNFGANQSSNTSINLGSGGGGEGIKIYSSMCQFHNALVISGGYNYYRGATYAGSYSSDYYTMSSVIGLTSGQSAFMEIDNNGAYDVSLFGRTIVSSSETGIYLVKLFNNGVNVMVFPTVEMMPGFVWGVTQDIKVSNAPSSAYNGRYAYYNEYDAYLYQGESYSRLMKAEGVYYLGENLLNAAYSYSGNDIIGTKNWTNMATMDLHQITVELTNEADRSWPSPE